MRSWIFEKHGTSFATTQWTVCLVAKRVTESAYDSVADLLSARKQDSIEKKSAPTQEPSNQCASQVVVTWRSYDARRNGIGGICLCCLS